MIKQNIGQKSRFFSYPSPAFDAAVRGGGSPCQNIAIPFGEEKLGWYHSITKGKQHGYKIIYLITMVNSNSKPTPDRHCISKVWGVVSAWLLDSEKDLMIRLAV